MPLRSHWTLYGGVALLLLVEVRPYIFMPSRLGATRRQVTSVWWVRRGLLTAVKGDDETGEPEAQTRVAMLDFLSNHREGYGEEDDEAGTSGRKKGVPILELFNQHEDSDDADVEVRKRKTGLPVPLMNIFNNDDHDDAQGEGGRRNKGNPVLEFLGNNTLLGNHFHDEPADKDETGRKNGNPVLDFLGHHSDDESDDDHGAKKKDGNPILEFVGNHTILGHQAEDKGDYGREEGREGSRTIKRGTLMFDLTAGASMISTPDTVEVPKDKKITWRQRRDMMGVPEGGRLADRMTPPIKYIPNPVRTWIVHLNERILTLWATTLDREGLQGAIAILTREMSLRGASDGISSLPDMFQGPAADLVNDAIDKLNARARKMIVENEVKYDMEKQKEKEEKERETIRAKQESVR